MPPSASTDLAGDIQQQLLALARRSIHQRLQGREALPEISQITGPLGEHRAVFVTLQQQGRLRGCIGTMEALQPLAIAVADAAVGAAHRDPRFPPLQASELETVVISISVLSEPEPLAAVDRQDLLAQLRPGLDGLVLNSGHRQATFLPQVWEQLPEKEDFLSQLMIKAGLPGDHWSPALRLSRYRSFSFTEC